jgi:tetrahydromethanopterin S-methyltransferase subunit F
MLPSELEPVIPANERPQTHTLDRAVNGIKYYLFIYLLIYKLVHN